MFLGKINECKISDEEVDRLAKLKMNGRQVSFLLSSLGNKTSNGSQLSLQIKNTLSNARSIALETQTSLSVVQVNAVLDVVSDWNTAKEKMALP
jgi:hypothetical protein